VSSNFAQSSSRAEKPITIFLSYAGGDDNKFKERIAKDLETLRRQGCPIKECICYDIYQALEFVTDIRESLKAYELYLFLLSPDFVNHEFCYRKEIYDLVKRHRAGVWVLPILVRACVWEPTAFGEASKQLDGPLPVLPHPQRPVTKWKDRDEAYKKIALGIKYAVERLKAHHI
jgi:hypothetical protein